MTKIQRFPNFQRFYAIFVKFSIENFLLSMNVFDTMCHHQILKYSKTINQNQRKDYTFSIDFVD